MPVNLQELYARLITKGPILRNKKNKNHLERAQRILLFEIAADSWNRRCSKSCFKNPNKIPYIVREPACIQLCDFFSALRC